MQVSASTSLNVTRRPVSKGIMPQQAKNHITPQRARKLAERLSKELVMLDSLQMRTQKLYQKMLRLSQA